VAVVAVPKDSRFQEEMEDLAVMRLPVAPRPEAMEVTAHQMETLLVGKAVPTG
jgi:hypothetical protein